MSNLQIAVRVDASDQIGTGHFMRCLALADALKARGGHTCFVARHLPKYLRDMAVEKGHQVVLLNSLSDDGNPSKLAHACWLGTSQQADARDCIVALSDRLWDWLIVDHYAIDTVWESSLRQVTNKILVIDDLADRSHNCDVLLDQNLYSDMNVRYKEKVPEGCKLLLGPRYAMLREEFSKLRERVNPRDGDVRRIFVFFGGVDKTNYTGRVMEALSKVNIKGIHVDVVVGSQHPYREQIEEQAAGLGFVCHVQTVQIAGLMAAADLAIGAGGISTWERCCLGLPALAIGVADNQHAQIDEAAYCGLLYAPEMGSQEELPLVIEQHVSTLLKNRYLRRIISTNGMRAVDGRGVQRVLSKLERHDIELREATFEDARKLFEWRNHPSIRAVSRNPDVIEWENHELWFTGILRDSGRFLLIGYRDDSPVGVVRFDVQEDVAEMSIYLVPGSKKMAQGSDLLQNAERWMAANQPGVRKIRACVLGHNERSQSLFLRAEYHVEYACYLKDLKK